MRPMLVSVTQQGTELEVISGMHRPSVLTHEPRISRRQGSGPVPGYRRRHSRVARQA
jgi:hypothetical protein